MYIKQMVKSPKLWKHFNSAIRFALAGLDYDLYQAEQKDLKNLSEIEEELAKARVGLRLR